MYLYVLFYNVLSDVSKSLLESSSCLPDVKQAQRVHNSRWGIANFWISLVINISFYVMPGFSGVVLNL